MTDYSPPKEKNGQTEWSRLYEAMHVDGVRDRFLTEEDAERRMVQVRWPSGASCLRCQSNDVARYEMRKKFQCRKCRYQFTVKTGTLLHGSNLSIRKWFLAAEDVIRCNALDRATDLLTGHQFKDRIGLSYKVAHALKKVLEDELSFPEPALLYRCICSDKVQSPPNLVQ